MYYECLTDTMATCTVRMSEKEKAMMESYAEFNGITLSELIRTAVMEKLEDEYDAKTADEAYRLFLLDPETVSFEDVKREYGL